MRRILPLFAVLTLALAALGAPSAQAVKRKASRVPPIGFGSAIVVDPVHTFGEPDIRIGKDGATHVSGPWGTGTQRSIWNLSFDGGRTFHTMHDRALVTTDGSATQHLGPGGGDTEIAIARDGRVFYSDLAALVSLKNGVWDPKQHTLDTQMYANGAENFTGIDRQWMALWDPPNVAAARRASGYQGTFPVNYQQWNAATTALQCDPPVTGSCALATYSYDGTGYTGATVTWPMENDGNPVIDQLTGTVIQSVSTAENGDEQYNDIGVAIVRRGAGAAPNDPALTEAEVLKISDLPLDDTTADAADHMGTRDLFPVTAIDAARNAYVIWINRAVGAASESPSKTAWQVYYAYASAASGWKKWSKPIKVSRPPSNTNIMPWAVAGSGGRLAIVWYGTDNAEANPSTTDAHQAWDVYLAMIDKANTPKPVVRQTKVTRHPMHYGTICLEGTGCIAQAGNRNLADFFMVEKDPRDGAVVIVYNDTSNELTQNVPPLAGPQIAPPVDGVVDHRGAPVVTVMRQNRGIGLFGRPVKGLPQLGSRMTDVQGDAVFDPVYGGVNVPELDLRDVAVKRVGDKLEIRVQVQSLDDLVQAHTALGARAITWVARWSGAAADSQTGLRNPIYYAAAESLFAGVGAGGSGGGAFEEVPGFYAGAAQSDELCSVSGCFPHLIDYPRPPLAGTDIAGQLVPGTGTAPDTLVFLVPVSAVGNPKPGSLLESFSVFAFARNKTSMLPITNPEGEAGITPIVIDGICCVDVRV
jgi:hypothetical protein